MTTAPERLRGATRWSMAARCARMASYGLLGVEPVPPTPRESGRFARGRDAGAYVVRQLQAKHGEDAVIPEKAVPWPKPPELPIGELHTDAVIIPDRLAVEVKNSTSVDSMFAGAVKQVAGAVHFDDDVDSGVVVFVDHDYQITDEFPVFLTDELVEEVEATAAAVVEAGKTGTVPDRICEKPADGRGHFCPFIEHCFADWEPPPAIEREELSVLASEGWLIQRDLKQKKGEEKALQQAWDEWKAKALEADIPLGETMAGPIRIKRTDRKGSQSFSLAKARSAGIWTSMHDEVFDPFIGEKAGSTTFDLIRTEAGALDLDFGEEVPF